ncbi:hypothetical protein R8510_02511 [Ralstonia chuxiongensis]|nr:hypothetical protein R8510_02511 [Ralstonia chuxiongensis]
MSPKQPQKKRWGVGLATPRVSISTRTEDYFSIVYLPFLVTLTIGVCTAS